jgi:hypothetical protein
MILWDRHKEFTSDFLTQHHDYVLFDLFHQVKAALLYPLNCSCQSGCECGKLREKIVLSLNVDAYNQAEARQEHPDRLYAIKMLFKIPDDTFFRKHCGEIYPMWLVQETLQKKEANNHFKIVERLVGVLLRLAQTYEISIFREPRASIKEAVELILGKTPLKVKARKQEQEPYLCGEKGYSAQLNTYKTVCHFVAAFQLMGKGTSCFSLTCPDKIREFLTLSHWFRKKLLAIVG